MFSLSNCYSHILHNSVKHAHRVLPIDIEHILLSIYSHFSRSAKRINELKQYYEFYEQDFKVKMSYHLLLLIYWFSLQYFLFFAGNLETYKTEVAKLVLINRTFSRGVEPREEIFLGTTRRLSDGNKTIF